MMVARASLTLPTHLNETLAMNALDAIGLGCGLISAVLGIVGAAVWLISGLMSHFHVTRAGKRLRGISTKTSEC